MYRRYSVPPLLESPLAKLTSELKPLPRYNLQEAFPEVYEKVRREEELDRQLQTIHGSAGIASHFHREFARKASHLASAG